MTTTNKYPLLSQIDDPSDLRELKESELTQLTDEARQFLIETVSQTGGHLAANLGTVELSVALHYIYNTPHDQLVWDVGHQSYIHKILTGRREAMSSIRQQGGLAGFPKRSESDYDSFGVGHSSTSISAALGMAIASKQTGTDKRVCAIIGDGAMTAGMAFEALNHAGDLDTNLLVILNDNDMSISPNVGGLSNYLARVLSGKVYSGMREGSKKVLSTIPPVWELARRTEEHVKGMVVPGTLFEELGFNYIGPIDGHDLPTLIKTLRNMRKLSGPQFLHIITQKGKGYAPAEDNPCSFHGVSTFDPKSGEALSKPGSALTYTQVFGEWLCDMAKQDPNLMAITPAMREGSGMVTFAEQYPEQYIDVGIAEQHSITLAAGLACEGIKPVVAIYSTFLQRGYDQLIHDVAIQNLPVLFAIDRAGLVGPDGPTHAGMFDLTYLRCIPNMIVMTPSDENECRQMLYTGYKHNGPAAVRYPRGAGIGSKLNSNMNELALGRGIVTRQGQRVALLVFGSPLAEANIAAENLDATVVNMRFVKPIDDALIAKLATSHDLLVSIEENVIAGGAGSAVHESLTAQGITMPLLQLGLPDKFVDHGDRNTLLSDCGLDSSAIIRAVESRLEDADCVPQPVRVK